MKFSMYTPAAIALCLSTGQAAALSATEAWQTYQEMLAAIGTPVTYENEGVRGRTLTVTGVATGFEQPGLVAKTQIGTLTFTEDGNGAVKVAFPETLTFTSQDSNGPEAVEIQMSFALPDLDITMSDADGGVAFEMIAPVYEARMDSFKVNDTVVPFNMFITLKDNITSYLFREDQSLSFKLTSGSGLEARFNGADPEGGGAVDMSFATDALSFNGTIAGNLIDYANPEDLRAALKDGANLDYNGEFGASAFALNMAEGNQTLQVNGEIGSSTGGFSMNQDEIALASTYKNISFSAAGSQIPLPQITGGAGELTTNMSIPIAVETPDQDFSLRMVMGDVTMGEMIWSMLDPAGAFPRDPATLLVDLAGKAKVMLDVFDETSFLSADEPAELEALTLSDLRLSLGGAQLTGTGDFTFDSANRGAFGGIPAPDGSVTLNLTGGNALLDVLTRMGLIGDEQAMMARMMTGMIAKPGNGPDSLVSEITLRPDGTVLANGAPLPF